MLVASPATAEAIVDLLAGVGRPAYGELRVLGHDLATIRGRAAVRRRVGVARRGAIPLPAPRIRGLVEHAARLARPDRRGRGRRGRGGPGPPAAPAPAAGAPRGCPGPAPRAGPPG